MKIKVETENGLEIIDISQDEIEHLNNEIQGHNVSIHEYKTISGKIITDLDIIGIRKE